MNFSIHKDFFGLPFHLIWNGEKFIKSDNITPFCLGTKEFETFSQLHLIQAPEYPPRNYLKAYQSILKTRTAQSIPWNFCVPNELLINSVKEIGKNVYDQIKDLDIGYYQNYFQKGNVILDSLEKSKINMVLYEEYKSNSIVNGFDPDEIGNIEIPIYSRTDTVTGRLKIISGPNILHLKKEWRNLIQSRFGSEGKIYYLDLKSLEPRLVLTFKHFSSGRLPQDSRDCYEGVKNILNNNGIEATRNEIKEAVISELYGAGINTIRDQFTKLTERELLYFIGVIKDYFGMDKLKEKLINEYENNNKRFIKNLYGRYVSAEDVGSYALINRLIQSTAVDVSLFSFSNIINFIKEMEWQKRILPLFVLHDALIIDIHESYINNIPTLCKIGSIDIPLLENHNFYIKAEEIK